LSIIALAELSIAVNESADAVYSLCCTFDSGMQ